MEIQTGGIETTEITETISSRGKGVLKRLRLRDLRGLILFLFCLLFVAGVDAQETPPKFLAGAATSNITPSLGTSINGNMNDIKAAHIHDELHVRCLALDDGKTRLAFAVVDNCLILREVFDESKRLVNEATGLPIDRMIMSATHTHSAGCLTGVFQSDPDPEYQKFVARRIADGIRRAINNLAPAKIGWGSVQVPDQVFNRRWTMKPGTIPPDPFGSTADKVKMNPSAGDENLIDPAGPTDPEVGFIAVRAIDGRPIALLANYSLHYVGGVGAGHISADYFGCFADRMKELIGPGSPDAPFVAMMTNGTSADINNIDFRKRPLPQQPYEQIRRTANRVAEEVNRAYAGVEFRPWVPLAVAQAEIELGVRLPSSEDVERAKSLLGANPPANLTTLETIYARETTLLAKFPPRVPLILQAIRIGDLGIATIPCEVFVEIGLEIKKKSPLKPAFTIELANGYNGYLPMPRHHDAGGYETWRARSSYLEKDASSKISAVVLRLLERVRQ